jgi:hypothetical protein
MHNDSDVTERLLTERVRAALIECALDAYTDAGVRGLCAEGAWEAAVAALRKLDLEPICQEAQLQGEELHADDPYHAHSDDPYSEERESEAGRSR